MRKVLGMFIAVMIVGVWGMKTCLIDIPALRLVYQVVAGSRNIEQYRIAGMRLVKTASGKEAHIRMLPTLGSGNPVEGVLTQYSLPLTGLSWNGLHSGVVMPTIPFYGRRVPLATAVLHTAFFQLVFGALPNVISVFLLASLFVKYGIAKQERDNAWGVLAFTIVYILPLLVLVGQAFFMAAIGSQWITSMRICAADAAISAGIGCGLLPISLIAVFNLPPLKLMKSDIGVSDDI